MRYIYILYILLVLISLGFPKVFIESNYPLRKNNFQEKVSEENMFLILWALQKLKDVKDIRIMTVGRDTVIYVERYPILKKIDITGNWFVSDEEIKNLLGVRVDEPLTDFDLENVKETLRIYYEEKGFLDARVDIQKRIDDKGFAYLKVNIKEGEVYFLGGGVFKGARSFSSGRLLYEAGLRLGDTFNEREVKKGTFRILDSYRKQGFLESSVYLEGVKKIKAKKPFPYVLFPGIESSQRSLKNGVIALFRGISNFLSHPIGVTKALFGKGSLAVPYYMVNEGNRYTIDFEGNKSFKDEELRSLIDFNTPGFDYFFLEDTKKKIEEFYRKRGFFDVKVTYSYERNKILFFAAACGCSGPTRTERPDAARGRCRRGARHSGTSASARW